MCGHKPVGAFSTPDTTHMVYIGSVGCGHGFQHRDKLA